MGNEFVPGRAALINHNDASGNRIHDPPAIEKKTRNANGPGSSQ